ncbi:MCE family protein [Mycolicibacter acidiphilus]
MAFSVMTAIALLVLGVYYLRLPSLMGIGQYTLKADLPAAGGLYKTANVTYRGVTIGKVTAVEPTEQGARATMSIGDKFHIPADAVANVHSVSAVGEQYLDLVSAGGKAPYLKSGHVITESTIPAAIGPALDTAYRGLAALPTEKISALLDETATAAGGLGPSLKRLVDSTQAIVGDFKDNLDDVDVIIDRSGPIIDSQVTAGDSIQQWARNLNMLSDQAAGRDPTVRYILKTLPDVEDLTYSFFSATKDSVPSLMANVAIIADMTKRYQQNIEQVLVFLPQAGSVIQTFLHTHKDRGALNVALGAIPGVPLGPLAAMGGIIPGLSLNWPPPCLTGYLPASQWRAFADTSPADVPEDYYCRIPQDEPSNNVRGVRNIPCADVPGKRAATPKDCRSDKPYIPMGTNPWYGDPNQIRTCPAMGARCDQPVEPGHVIPGPSINNGLNPLPADQVSPSPPPKNDPVSRPGSGHVQCNGQQPNPCIYTPGGGPAAVYNPQNGQVTGPDGSEYALEDSTNTGDDAWKSLLKVAPGLK